MLSVLSTTEMANEKKRSSRWANRTLFKSLRNGPAMNSSERVRSNTHAQKRRQMDGLRKTGMVRAVKRWRPLKLELTSRSFCEKTEMQISLSVASVRVRFEVTSWNLKKVRHLSDGVPAFADGRSNGTEADRDRL